MKYHGGVSWQEMYDMPIAYKHWFLKRLSKELDKEGAQSQDTAKGPETPSRAINFKRLQQMFAGDGEKK